MIEIALDLHLFGVPADDSLGVLDARLLTFLLQSSGDFSGLIVL